MMINRRLVLMVLMSATLAGSALAQTPTGLPRFITVSSTTSTTDSGLFTHLLPIFKARTGIDVRVVSQGTGQALDTGRRGDVDVVFVHARAQEEKFVADGFGVARHPVMYNDFVLIGPKTGVAAAGVNQDVMAALRTIREKALPFVSRGDRSGTHTAELDLWKQAGIDVEDIRKSAGSNLWYREIGQGMGAALNTASAMGAYLLSDRATWINFKNRGDLVIAVEGDRRLFNQYGIMLVNPARHSHVKAADGQLFIDWVLSAEGQTAIAGYRINGEQLFFPNADKKGT